MEGNSWFVWVVFLVVYSHKILHIPQSIHGGKCDRVGKSLDVVQALFRNSRNIGVLSALL